MISNVRWELRGKTHETIKLIEESLNKVGSVCLSLGDEGIFLSSEHRTLARLTSVGGSWSKNGCHRFIYLNAWGWPCSIGLGGVALLEEVYLWRWALRVQSSSQA